MEALLAGIVVWVLGGAGSVVLSRFPRLASAAGASATILGALLGLPTAAGVLLNGRPQSQVLNWDAAHGSFQVELDALGAVFVLPILVLAIICAVYGVDYLWGYRHRKSLGGPWFFFNAFIAGMTLVVLSRTVLLFFVAWELMSLAAFFLVTFEHEEAGVRRAGWIYLVATHLGVAFLFGAFFMLASQTRSLEFAALHLTPSPSALTAGVVFVLSLVGFGAKAGLVPFHVWLPEAHPAAPSHVSALMSGVMIKMGLYGLLRVLTFLGPPAAWWGITLTIMGMITALVGISLAVHQRDIKRSLAYSSIENVGLITLSLGIGLWGQASQRPMVATLGMAGALLHIWNHALMKSLMFLAAGSVLHATGTRDMEFSGGLMKRMPWTAASMVLGAVAIAALPPLNGFVSEWLMYLSLLYTGFSATRDHGLTALLTVGLLALVGGLAAVTFVRLTGIALLGAPRSAAASHAHESSLWIVGPLSLLAASCLAMAVLPCFALDGLTEALLQLQGNLVVTKEAIGEARHLLVNVGIFNTSLLLTGGILFALLCALKRASTCDEGSTWGCGYARPTVRMQYTGQSFAEMLSRQLLLRFLRPRYTQQAPEGLFPAPGRFASQSSDPLSEKVYEPLFARWARRCAQLRILQQGQVNIYLAYVVLAVLLVLAWMSLRALVEDGRMSEWLVVGGILACAVSGLPGLFFARSTCAGQWVSNAILVTGCALGLAGVGVYWSLGNSREILLAWPVPGGEFRVAMDGLSALFLAPIFVIAALGSVYGLSYWKQSEQPGNGRKLRLFYGLLPAGMALLVIARNSLLFLAGWEIMALSAFFLVTTQDHEEEVRRAGWIYFVATHISTLCLFALFATFAAASGSFQLKPLREDQMGSSTATAIFILCLAGFGLKAGVMPLHVWLPSAHAMAPSHVSAMMSGVLIKMGIYGIVRMTSFLPHPPLAWGGTLLALGAVSGVLGVAYAIGQHDLKRLLAYHSIENIGIIVMGIGLALAGRSLGRTDWIILGMAGGLLHVWNHALFKALLFLGAGSVIHATGTREIDRLGGLAKAMPQTALCFLVGAVAICGLPPLNGFVSEFLVYVGLFRTLGLEGGPTFIAGAFVAPALALIGALAVACFVKVFGAVFLGASRSQHSTSAHESHLSMVGPMWVLVACCFVIGLAPVLLDPILTSAVGAWAFEVPASQIQLANQASLGWISVMGFFLLAGIAATSAVLRLLLSRSALGLGPTWGCGYAAPTARMQYTSSSFAQMLVTLFAWALRPRRRLPINLPLFPAAAAFRSEVPDATLEDAVLPAFRFSAWLFGWCRVFQQGSIQAYLLYIFLTLVVLLVWRFI